MNFTIEDIKSFINTTAASEYFNYALNQVNEINCTRHKETLVNSGQVVWDKINPHMSQITVVMSAVLFARGVSGYLNPHKGVSFLNMTVSSAALLGMSYYKEPEKFSTNFQCFPWFAACALAWQYRDVSKIAHRYRTNSEMLKNVKND